MTLEEALDFADECKLGRTLHDGPAVWRAAWILLADEVRRRHGIGCELIAARRERDELEYVLTNNGFVRCDMAACNCGSWHARYGLQERWNEVKDEIAEAGHPLSNENGHIVLNALQALIAERNNLRALATCGCGDGFTADDPGMCVNCAI